MIIEVLNKPKNYEFERFLGKGSFGCVSVVKLDKISQIKPVYNGVKRVALKTEIESTDDYFDIEKESNFLTLINELHNYSPFINKTFQVYVFTAHSISEIEDLKNYLHKDCLFLLNKLK